MTAKLDKSGFMSQSVAPVGLNMLPRPMMYFVVSEAHPIDRVFLPALFDANPRGLVVGIRPFEGMKENIKIVVSLISAKGKTTLTHYVDGLSDQAIGVTKEQILVHQGEQVTVSYMAFMGEDEVPSLPCLFTVAEAKLKLDELPGVDQVDVEDGVISLEKIEGQGGARFRLPPIPGLYRGMLLTTLFQSGSLSHVVRRSILTTPDVNIDFFVLHKNLAEFVGREVTFSYYLWLLDDVSYRSNSPNYKFNVVP